MDILKNYLYISAINHISKCYIYLATDIYLSYTCYKKLIRLQNRDLAHKLQISNGTKNNIDG